MLSVLSEKTVIVVEPLISIIDDQLKLLPKSMTAVRFRASVPDIVQQVKRANLGTYIFLHRSIDSHPRVYLAPESVKTFVKLCRYFATDFFYYVSMLVAYLCCFQFIE